MNEGLPINPTPAQRADVVVRRLEQFIRENRSERGGMSFQKWQELARFEIEDAILEDEKTWREDKAFVNKVLAVAAAAVVTIGFWGTVAAVREPTGLSEEALLMFAGGMILFAGGGAYGIWRAYRRFEADRRDSRLKKIKSLDAKLRKLDRDLEKRVKELERSLEALANIKVDAPQAFDPMELAKKLDRILEEKGNGGALR